MSIRQALRLTSRPLCSLPSPSRSSLAKSHLSSTTMTTPTPRFIDIGVNLTDTMYQGQYNGKQAHEPDLAHVLSRARAAGVVAQIVTGGSLSESSTAIELAKTKPDLYSTAGCHPTRCSEFESYDGGAEAYLAALSHLVSTHSGHASDGKSRPTVVAIGECGLDYDRLHFCPADVQKRYFDVQLTLAIKHKLPLFLHSRAAHADLVSILRPRMEELAQANGGAENVGVVHSFDGSQEEMKELIDMGLSIGINGCSLKTEANLDVVKQIPLDRLLLETDAPWCEPRPSHASSAALKAFKASAPALAALYFPETAKKEKWEASKAVKGRHEPCGMGQIAAVVASVKGLGLEEVAKAAEDNTRRLFRLP